MTFVTKLRTGFEIGNFALSDTGTVFVGTPTTNLNAANKSYTDIKVNDAITFLSTASTVLTGDVTGSGINSIPTTLSQTGVSSGTYSLVTVDTKGRITAGNNITFNQGNVQGSVAGSQVTLNLVPTGVSAGTYTIVNVDTSGRITAGANLTSSNVTTALGFTPVNKAGDTLSGRLSTSLAPLTSGHLVNKKYSDKQFYMSIALGS